MEQTASNPQLPTFFSLVRESLQLYRAKWQTLLTIALVQSVFVFFAAIIAVLCLAALGLLIPGIQIAAPHFAFAGPAAILILILMVVGAILFSAWTASAMIVVLRDNQESFGLLVAIKRARKYVFDYLWATILAGLAIFAGLIFFIIPGILFLIWFMFARYIVITENERGIVALSKSREYARGYFWGIFLLYLLLMLSLFFIDSLLGMFGNSFLGNIVQAAGSILVIPLAPIYYFLLLGHLRRIKGRAPAVVAASQKKLFPALATLGLVLLIAVIGLFVLHAPQINDFLKTEMQNYQMQNRAPFPVPPIVTPPGSV
jgi:hypothetical protein